jgi:hypothetical protein
MTTTYQAVGGEVLVNTTTASSQVAPDIAMLSGGGYVVVWESFAQDGSAFGVYAQRYNAAGVRQGGETRVNTTTANDQSQASVAALPDGGYVVTWASRQDGSDYGIYAQRFDASGVAQGGETLVNTTTANTQFLPSVAALAGGGYVIAWSSVDSEDDTGLGFYTQRFNASGVRQGGETLINTTAADAQDRPVVAALADGGYVVAWAAYNAEGSGWEIYAQRYNAAGAPQGGEILVNTTTEGLQIEANVASLADGGFVIAWDFFDQDGSASDVHMQRFDAAGAKQGSETLVNTTTADYQQRPALAVLPDGGYVVTWISLNQDGSGWGVYAQRYDASGVKDGAETLINTTTANDQVFPTVSSLPGGGYVVAWASDGQDGSEYGVYSTRFLPVAESSTPDLVAASDTGNSQTDNLTGDKTPTFTGTALAGSTVRLLEGTKQLGQAVADSAGAWTITSTGLSAGSHAISATATLGGLVGPRSDTLTVVIDTVAPTRPSKPDLAPDSDTGSSSADNITSDATPTLQGTAAAGSLVTLKEGAATLGAVSADGSGHWSITSSTLSEGVHRLAVSATDDAGNVSASSALLTLTIDTQMLAPTFSSVTATKLFGSAEAGALVRVFEGGTLLGEATATSKGTWVLSQSLSDAPHTLTITANDKAGNSADAAGQILIGSSSADSLSGDFGDDRIFGLAGADTLEGAAGDDAFVFASGFGQDVINGFVAGAATEDQIQLTKAMLGVGNSASAQTAFNAVLAKTQDVAGSAVITIDSDNRITLTGVAKADLDIGDFIFT